METATLKKAFNAQLRQRLFMRECQRQKRLSFSTDAVMSEAEITRRASLCEAQGYFVEYGYALRKVRPLVRGILAHGEAIPAFDPLREGERGRMWREIAAKVARRIIAKPSLTFPQALMQVLVDEKASSYFMTPAYALRLYQRLSQK